MLLADESLLVRHCRVPARLHSSLKSRVCGKFPPELGLLGNRSKLIF
jgi:hypothetical protein